MLRILFYIVAMSLSLAATDGLGAAPLQILPGAASPSGYSARHYAQYAPGTAAVPVPAPLAASAPARVYLMRGFLNIFSLGMDDLAEKIQANGLFALATNHADAEAVVSQILARYAAGDRGPIILIGHSLGADAVIDMADILDRNNIPVALAVLFDGTAPHPVPKNVAAAVNYTLQFDLTPGPGFRGKLTNVDLGDNPAFDHLSIDKSPELQARTLDDVFKAAGVSAIPNSPEGQR